MTTSTAPVLVLTRVPRTSRARAMLASRGLACLAFAAAALFGSDLPLSSLASMFGVFLLASSALALFDGLWRPSRSLLVLSSVSLPLGALLFLRPWPSQRLFVYLVGAWAMLAGLLELVAAGTWRRNRPTEWLEAGAGISWLLLGAFLGVFPETPVALGLVAGGALASGLCLAAAAAGLRSGARAGTP